ncbi:MAG: 50S ribosomal protein L11 methyltransferase [Bacteroidales bacterium]|nr:50S ribosomal protein L11 methyltransferase [Bacteroidales bacterium]
MYTEYQIVFDRGISEEEADIIVALLSQTEFESFENDENAVKAYIQKEKIDNTNIEEIVFSLKMLYEFKLEVKEIETVNWNEVWEKDYEPVFVNEQCVIKAPFHSISPSLPYEITIEPKMAFGTGHHETTAQMSDLLFDIPLKRKTVCDAGTGSGILSILAIMLGANSVFAYDIDEWSVRNTKENLKINKITKVEVKQGDVSVLQNMYFDVILANINRNILLKDVVQFVKSLNKKGTLIVSGFYTQDMSIIQQTFTQHGLHLVRFKTKNNWVVAEFNLKN